MVNRITSGQRERRWPLALSRSSPSRAGTPGVKWATSIIFLLTLVVLVASCRTTTLTPKLERFSFTSPHMGTLCSITLYATNETSAVEAGEAAFERIARLEDKLSDYIADSELMQLGAAPPGKPIAVSEDLFTVMERAAAFSAETDGAFDITAGPFTRLWRFSRKREALPSEDALDAARKGVGWEKITLDRGTRTATLTADDMRLDLGGIGKGFAADEAMRVLQEHGINRALVAVGGDILTSLPPPNTEGWQVVVTGIGRPEPNVSGWVSASAGTPSHRSPSYSNSGVGLSIGAGSVASGSGQGPVQTTLLVRNAAVSTSGDTEQFVEIEGVRYSHIVSPFTGLGLTNRIQATVIAPDATTSDALATACCILGPEQAIHLADSIPKVAALVVIKEGTRSVIWRSKRAP